MAGMPGRSGGSNAISLEEHRLRGTFRPSRHASRLERTAEAISPAERRRTLRGLTPEARHIAARLLDQFGSWDEASLRALRAYAESCVRLEALQRAPGDDTRALHREVRANVLLLRALNLEVPGR
jgi:hypothetical protein